MASVIKTSRGKQPSRAVQFTRPDGTFGKRCTIRLGKVTYDAAHEFKRKVERLLAWSITNESPDVQTATWLQGLPDSIHAKLADHGLVAPREPEPTAPTLGKWLGKYLKQRTDLKPSSRKKLERTKHYLVEHFGAELHIDKISVDIAKDWRVWLTEQGLAEATVRLHCRNAKTIFNEAHERELIDTNPFRKLASRAVAGTRDRYVTPDETKQVLDVCPNVQWRTLFGLARLAGLRVPSETHLLTWTDVDWGRCRLSVFSPKTERFEEHKRRIVPIVPKLMAVLQDNFDAAEDGQERIITLSRNNLHRTFEAILKRASVIPWPKPFQTLRQSCDTEWKLTFPAHAVNQWLGHSEQISRKHYLMVPDEVYDMAAGLVDKRDDEGAAKSVQNALQQPLAPS